MTARPLTPPGVRNDRIDFLRGVAIGCVLLLHFTLAYRFTNSPLIDLFTQAQLKAVFFQGNYGVTIFFVVSGFLITSTSIRRWGSLSAIDLRDFYVLRLARILPCLALALSLIVTLGLLGVPYFTNTDGGHALPSSFFAVAALSVLTFWHNLLMQQVGWFNYALNIDWSLSIEEIFYVCLPLVCLLLKRTRLLVTVCLALVVFGPIDRSLHLDNDLYWECGTFACLDSIALGCLTALVSVDSSLRGRAALRVRLLSATALVAVYFAGIDGHEVFGFSMISVATAFFLLSSANDDTPGWTTGRTASAIRWLGRRSYECYLFHIVVLALMRNVIGRAELARPFWFPWLIAYLAATCIVTWGIARYVSVPANRFLRRRFLRSIGAERSIPCLVTAA